MMRQMSDAELDAILGVVNDEIHDVIEEAADVTAGREQVLREADHLFLAPPPVWKPLPPTCKELTWRADLGMATHDVCTPFLMFPACRENSTVSDVLAELDGLGITLAAWADLVRRVDENRMVLPFSAGRLRWLLSEVRRGLEERTLDRQEALEKIDELSEEVRPLASCSTKWHIAKLPEGRTDPQEFLIALAQVRRDVDRLYDDGDNLVTC
ncbi:hypothetical protein AB0K21_43750 [Streptosporangium sp. NPDC049248]|uniref:hypothetical protein n=1 Tax=Streptosporangium sp. NPDC049248 TaxID=3155651 RepID=UPI003430D275